MLTSTPVAGHERCVERSSGAAGRPRLPRLACSRRVRAPEIILTVPRVSTSNSRAAETTRDIVSIETPHLSANVQASESVTRSLGRLTNSAGAVL